MDSGRSSLHPLYPLRQIPAGSRTGKCGGVFPFAFSAWPLLFLSVNKKERLQALFLGAEVLGKEP